MDINVTFANPEQREFYYATSRNQTFSGGFNNGKTFIGCLKASTLLLSFRNYRMAIARERYVDLKRTTMQSFFKQFPSELIESHNEQEGVTRLKNFSSIYWMHLDSVDENSLRGLEINSVLVDQAEEMSEKVYDVLDSRIGRWDGAIVPDEYLAAYPEWPRDKFNKPIVPSYLMLLTNPDTQFHFIYRKYHPDSEERKPNHFYIEGQWDPNLGSVETYQQALTRDDEWKERYLKGKWGLSQSQIHYLPPSGILDPTPELLKEIKEKGNLFRVLDHGDSAPTCCLWLAVLGSSYICYREYYVPGRVISYHRKAITELSGDEKYSANYADPQIFKKTAQKDGGFWSVSQEYNSKDIDGPVLNWLPADNNEFATRNRINELLTKSDRYAHPITKERPAIGLYFLRSTQDYHYGAKESIRQISAQRKVLIGTIEGKSIYSDDRDKSIVDHAYDCVRYFVAMHGTQPTKSKKRPPRHSFAWYNSLLDSQKNAAPVPASIQ